MTINPSAWILLAMYVAVAEERGLDFAKLSGTIQNDILKEYIAQKEWIYPPRESMRIVRDTITYAAEHLPRYNPINISGYHISEAGASADPGGRLHDGGHARVRARGDRGGRRRRHVRAAAVVLLRLPVGLLRGDREVPGAAPRLREDDARRVRRHEGRVDAAALPHADRGGDADQGPARQQRRADRVPGDVGRARRHPVAAHQRARRGVRDPVASSR